MRAFLVVALVFLAWFPASLSAGDGSLDGRTYIAGRDQITFENGHAHADFWGSYSFPTHWDAPSYHLYDWNGDTYISFLWEPNDGSFRLNEDRSQIIHRTGVGNPFRPGGWDEIFNLVQGE